MTKNEFYFSSADETTGVYAVEWLPKGEPKAVLQMLHGDAGNIFPYEELAEFFTGHGFLVVENERLGQKELHTCLKLTKKKYPDIPYLLLGVFQGAFAVHSFVQNHPEAVEGVVLADAEQQMPPVHKELPVLQISGVKENQTEAFQHIYQWTAEHLDEMLYRAATKQ